MEHELLLKLLDTVSVSGNEDANQKTAAEYMKGFAHEVVSDPVGNVTGILNPDAPLRVMLTAHMDEIGFRVTHITDEGFVRVQKAGGVSAGLYIGAPMQIIHEEETENGIVYRKVRGVGVVNEDLLKKEKPADKDLLIDIGAVSRAEAEKVISPGDSVCADTQYRELLNNRFSCRALDDKTGAFVVMKAAEKAALSGVKTGVLANTSCGEETTGRGAYFAAQRLKPDCVIAVDVTYANDYPGTDPGDSGSVRLGKGPVLCLSGMTNKKMNRLLEETAKDLGISLQYEIAAEATYTDGDIAMKTGKGVPLALVSIPLRYMHSSVETASMKDLEDCIDLLSAFLMRIDSSFGFCPFAL